MRIPREENIDEIIGSIIIEYCNEQIFPYILKDKVNVHCRMVQKEEFNAVVKTSDCFNYSIEINSGIIKTFINVINALKNSEIDIEISRISGDLLNDESRLDDIYINFVSGATIFVILHELAHIFRGHLHFLIKKRFYGLNQIEYNFKEISKEPQIQFNDFNGLFLKLAELDADASSINIYLQISLEIFNVFSEFFESENPDWNKNENPKWRIAADKIAYYSISLALSMMEVNRGNNKLYPKPITRFLNISDAFRQYTYDFHGILSQGKGGELQYFKFEENQNKIREENVSMPFLYALDIIIETAKIFGIKIYASYGNRERLFYEKLYSDFWNTEKTLDSEGFQTKEGLEFQELRILRSDFYKVFESFIIF